MAYLGFGVVHAASKASYDRTPSLPDDESNVFVAPEYPYSIPSPCPAGMYSSTTGPQGQPSCCPPGQSMNWTLGKCVAGGVATGACPAGQTASYNSVTGALVCACPTGYTASGTTCVASSSNNMYLYIGLGVLAFLLLQGD
jgi:hypothetical protein